MDITPPSISKVSQFTPLLTPHFSRGLSAPCGISYVTGGQADSSPCHPSASPDPVRKIQRLSQPLRPRKNDLFLGFREPSFIYLRTWVVRRGYSSVRALHPTCRWLLSQLQRPTDQRSPLASSEETTLHEEHGTPLQ